MKKKAVFVFLTCMAIAGCGTKGQISNSSTQLLPSETQQIQSTEEGTQEQQTNIFTEEQFEKNYEQFAFTLLKQNYKAEENKMISPLSVIMAFSMTQNGAKGETLSQMEQVIFNGSLGEQFVSKLCEYTNRLTNTENARFCCANSIWLKDTESLHVNEQFLQKNRQQFDAEIFKTPFDEVTLKDINTWVSNETEQMIPVILDRIEDGALMYLINTAVFDAKWKENYNEAYDISDGIFTNETGSQQTVSMMSSTEQCYFEDETAVGFLKPYAEGYSFLALLPNEGIAMEDYVNELSAEKWQNLLEHASYDFEVSAKIPEFSSEYSVELSEILKELGMTDAFDCEKADFTGIGTVDNENLYLNMALHKTYIEVNRHGTKAAAVTVIGVDESAPAFVPERKEVVLDRPFVYAVIDNESKLPIFLGIMQNM